MTLADIDLSSQPWLLWAIAAVLVLKFASDALPNILGPISRAIHDWGSSRRAAAREKDQEEDDELKDKIELLQVMLKDEQAAAAAERLEAARWRQTCSELYGYILRAQRDPAKLGDKVPEPPAPLASQNID